MALKIVLYTASFAAPKSRSAKPSNEAAKIPMGNMARRAFQAISAAQFGAWSSRNFRMTRPGTLSISRPISSILADTGSIK